MGPEVSAFRSAKHLAAWAGVAPGNHKSAGKRLSRRTRKGNPALKTALVECALGAARTHGTHFHSYHKARKAGGRYNQATMAKAHKMLRIIYAMLRDSQPYHDSGVDYERTSLGPRSSQLSSGREEGCPSPAPVFH
ncbi:MAG: transposase [Bryobacterales bacterium]|nr:transposase [Bryobacterales bacterium]